MKTLIKNGNVVLGDGDSVKKVDVLIENKTILEIGENLKEEDCDVINISNLFLIPGLIDSHVHLRDPGFLEKETIETGAKAAAAGGITTVCCMPNTFPVADSEEVLSYILNKAEKSKIEILPIAAITANLEGTVLTNFEKLKQKGAVGFSDDGRPVENAEVLEKAMIKAKQLNVPIVAHCEDLNLSKGGVINEGKISKLLNLKGISPLSEELSIKREIELAKKTGCRLHIAHVSTKNSVNLIKKAKQEGIKITAETCPHYFMLTEDCLLNQDPNFKMNPPLRTEEDRAAIEQAIIEKTIDSIATDHAPHESCNKKDLETASMGVIGLETSLACVLTHFYQTKKLNLEEIVKLMASNPSKIFKIEGGKIEKGSKANLAVVDLNKSFVVDSSKFFSKSKNSPFIGKILKGKVVKTFYNGNIVFEDL